MSKFSEIPYFILYEYFIKLLQEDSSSAAGDTSIFAEVNFKDRQDVFEFTDRTEDVWSDWGREYKNDTYVSGSYLRGMNKTIVVSGGSAMEFWVKDPSVGYKSISAGIHSINGNTITLKRNPSFSFLFSESITTVSSEITYYNSEEIEQDINEFELYFRKDGEFYWWLVNEAGTILSEKYNINVDIRNYVNTDKAYLYFGTLYERANNYVIITYNGYKDYVLNCVPNNLRTDNFKKFIDLNFDISFNELYYLEKNLFSLLDSYEIDKDFLNYLSKACHIDIDDLLEEVDDINLRNFVYELVNILKKKGTFSALLSIWNIITGSKGKVRFFEGWHNKNIEEKVDEYYIYPWLRRYNQYSTIENEPHYYHWEERYYLRPYPLNLDFEVPSSLYNVEIDLTYEPISKHSILSEKLINKMYDYWEDFRPIDKISDYNLFISPKIRPIKKEYKLYDSSVINFYSSGVLEEKDYIFKSFIKKVWSDGTSFNINHNLNTRYTHIQIFYDDFTIFYTNNINFVDENNLEISLSYIGWVYVFIRIPDFIFDNKNQFKQHNLNTEYLQSTFTDNTNTLQVEYETPIDGNTYDFSPLFTPSFIRGNFIFRNETPSTTWEVNHTLNSDKVFVTIYDEDKNKIYPSNIEIIDENNLTCTFKNNVSGYCIISNVNDLNVYYSRDEVESLIINHPYTNPYVVIQVFDAELNQIFPENITFMGSNSLKVSFESPLEFIVLIREAENSIDDLVKIQHNLSSEVLSQSIDISNDIVLENKTTVLSSNILGTDLHNGTTIVSKKSYNHIQSFESGIWNIQHNLDSFGILVNVYDENENKIYPSDINIIDQNNIQIVIGDNIIGNAVIIAIDKYNLLRYMLSNKLVINDEYEYDIFDVWETSEFIFVKGSIPKDIEYNIEKIEVFNDFEKLITCRCDGIYKHLHMGMDIFYRISKES